MYATIKNGKNTANHATWLGDKGYKVQPTETGIRIECEGFVDALDLSTDPVAALKGVVEKKQLLTYTTKILFPDGKVLFGVPACCRLGAASAMVASPEKAPKEVKQKGYDF